MASTAIISARKFGLRLVRWFSVAAMAGAGLCISSTVQAGFLDALFGGFGVQQRTYYADPRGDIAPRDVTPGYSTAGKAFCVRLCDGRYYPIASGSPNSTPVQMCSAMCPAAKTRIFSGGEIDQAVDANGSNYTKLDHAFAYRKSVVPGCTCNGKDAFGLVQIEAKSDPTLRPGDIVATRDGFKSVVTRGGETALAGSARDRLSSGLRVSERP